MLSSTLIMVLRSSASVLYKQHVHNKQKVRIHKRNHTTSLRTRMAENRACGIHSDSTMQCLGGANQCCLKWPGRLQLLETSLSQLPADENLYCMPVSTNTLEGIALLTS